MPTQRFFNLPKDKQERILQSAKKELSRVSFDEASINRIVKDAAIPRGSFYQYFENIEDVTLYLIGDYKKAVIEHVTGVVARSNGDLFEIVENSFLPCVKILKDGNVAKLFHNLFSSVKICESHVFDVLSPDNSNSMIEKYNTYINWELYNVNTAEDKRDMVEILLILTRYSSVKALISPSDTEEVTKSFLNKLSILKHGYLKETLNA